MKNMVYENKNTFFRSFLRFRQFQRFLLGIPKEFDHDGDGDDFKICCPCRPTGHFDGLRTASTNDDQPYKFVYFLLQCVFLKKPSSASMTYKGLVTRSCRKHACFIFAIIDDNCTTCATIAVKLNAQVTSQTKDACMA